MVWVVPLEPFEMVASGKIAPAGFLLVGGLSAAERRSRGRA
jgi:hypothetical protein